MTVDSSSASARLSSAAGERVGFALHHHKRADTGDRTGLDAGRDRDPAGRHRRRVAVVVASCTRRTWDRGSDLVHHSGRVLQALSFQPTGAICAAATTSLPETVGGDRNWDYRYAWVRDASFTIEALWVAACPDEANEFFDYITASAAGSLDDGGDLQIMFGIGGERDLTERELPHLPGWRGSAPVRVGNGAWRQRQLDVYGELLSAVHRLSDRLFDPVGPGRPPADAGRWDAPPSWRRARGSSSSRSPTPPPRAGGRRTMASGRSAANRGTSSTRS